MTYLFRLNDQDIFRDTCKDRTTAQYIAKKLVSMYRTHLCETGAFLSVIDEREQEIIRIQI